MSELDSATATTAGVTVRLARPDELDAAGQAVRDAYLVDGLGDEDYLPVLADARDRATDADVAVAVDRDGHVLGSVTFVRPGTRWAEISKAGEAEFRMLGVAPAGRGQGAGAALMEWCIQQAEVIGVQRLVLSSDQRSRSAHRIYQRRGFQRRPDLDWSPAPGIQLLGFSLDLA